MTDPHRRRVRHVVTENARVQAFEKELSKSLDRAGELLYQSHQSLRDDFEASWDRADRMVEEARGIEGIYGSRMTGAGWGGSMLFLTASEQSAEVRDKLHLVFKELFGEEPTIHLAQTSDGVRSSIAQPPDDPAITNFLEQG